MAKFLVEYRVISHERCIVEDARNPKHAEHVVKAAVLGKHDGVIDVEIARIIPEDDDGD